MIPIIGSIFSFIVAISVLVTIHEFGHFIVARAVGVKVLTFSIGFGRPLWRKRFSPEGTQFQVAVLPLGGYVKMYGEQAGDIGAENKQHSFAHKPLWARVAVVSAGPMFNFIFAILAYWLVFVSGVMGVIPIVGEVTAGSPAAAAGMRSGDQIVAVAGHDVQTWEQALTRILDNLIEVESIQIALLDGSGEQRHIALDVGEQIKIDGMDQLIFALGFRPYRPPVPPVLGSILPEGAAQAAKLQVGDRILAANGVTLSSWSEWVEMIRKHPEQSLNLMLERDGRQLDLVLIPRAIEEDGEIVGKIGAGVKLPDRLDPALMTKVQFPPVIALQQSIEKTWSMTSLTLRLMAKMISGDVSLKNLSGPVSIAQYAGYSAADGILSFLSFLAVVSISLGVLNLLPVPILDGGHLLYYGIEFVLGRPLSARTQAMGFQIGIVMLLSVTLIAFYNDLIRLFQ